MTPRAIARRVVSGLCLLLSAPGLGWAQPEAPAESLADAWRIALQVDRNSRASRQLTESARHALDAAKAVRLPAVSLDVGYTVLDHAPATIVDIPAVAVPGIGEIQLPFNRLSVSEDRAAAYSAIGTLPIYTSGRIREGIAAARSRVEGASAGEAIAALSIKRRVGEAYLAVLRAARLVDLLDTEVKSLAAHASDAANLVEQGIAATNDRLAADVAVADARQQRIQAANALEAARASYNRLLDRAFEHVVRLEEPGLTPPDGDLVSITERAITQRPELAALASQAQVSRHRAGQLQATMRPQVTAQGGYTYQENRYQLYPGVWSVGLRARWNLFDGGAGQAEAAAERAQADATLTQQEDLRSLVALQVRQAWLDFGSARERVAVTRDAVAQADENLRVARDRYGAGIGIATEVLDAEALRARSQMNLAVASYDRQLAVLQLRFAVGEL